MHIRLHTKTLLLPLTIPQTLPVSKLIRAENRIDKHVAAGRRKLAGILQTKQHEARSKPSITHMFVITLHFCGNGQ